MSTETTKRRPWIPERETPGATPCSSCCTDAEAPGSHGNWLTCRTPWNHYPGMSAIICSLTCWPRARQRVQRSVL